MPLGGLRTFTNMGANGGTVEGDEWKAFDDGITPSDPTMIEMGETKPAARQPPAEIKQQGKQSKPKKRSQRQKEADEKAAAALEEAHAKDLDNRNIRPKNHATTRRSKRDS